MGYVERHLLPNEQVLYKTRLHWILFARPVLVTLLGLALTVGLGAATRIEWLWYVSLLVIVAGLVWNGIHAIALLTSEFAVTTTRLIFKVGIVARYTTELLLGKVESIGVQQKLLGRFLNYGDLVVTGTGGAREVFPRVHDPIGFRNHVQQASVEAPPRLSAASPDRGPRASGSLAPGMAPDELRVEDEPRLEDLAALDERLHEYNVRATGHADGRWLAIFVRDGAGQLVAGLHGWTWGGTGFVRTLWVREDLRGTGLGARLLQRAEQEAVRRGCREMQLDTHSYQAPDFYRSQGYEQIGELPGWPGAQARRFFFRKTL